MPSKQIYIKESDLPLFDEATQYGESLSKVLSEALRQFVEKKRAEKDAEGNTEIEIIVGDLKHDIATTTLKFIGKLIATDQTTICNEHDEAIGTEYWAIYRTQKGKFLIYKKSNGTETDWDEDGPQTTPYEISKYFIVEALPSTPSGFFGFKVNDEELPHNLLIRAFGAIRCSNVEWLDI